jgi:hypothetical protein
MPDMWPPKGVYEKIRHLPYLLQNNGIPWRAPWCHKIKLVKYGVRILLNRLVKTINFFLVSDGEKHVDE